MPEGYSATAEEIANLKAQGLLANKRGTGYYDPNDQSQAYIFGKKSWNQQHAEKGLTPTKSSYYFVDAQGNPVTDESTIAKAAEQINDPEIKKHFSKYLNTGETKTEEPSGEVATKEQNVGKIGESDFSRAMHNTALGIAGAAGVGAFATTGAAEGIAELGKLGAQGAKTAYNTMKDGFNVYRSTYGRSPQMLQQNRWYT